MDRIQTGRTRIVLFFIIACLLFLTPFMYRQEAREAVWKFHEAQYQEPGADWEHKIYPASSMQSMRPLALLRTRRLKDTVRKTAFYILTFAVLMEPSFRMRVKRAFLAYLQTHIFPLAQFLYELSARQKKDGKKRKRTSAFEDMDGFQSTELISGLLAG